MTRLPTAAVYRAISDDVIAQHDSEMAALQLFGKAMSKVERAVRKLEGAGSPKRAAVYLNGTSRIAMRGLTHLEAGRRPGRS